MAAIFTNQTANFDGSGAPTVGTADVKIDYECSLSSGGQLVLHTRNNGAATDYKSLIVFNNNSHVLFKAENIQYYFTWIPRIAGADASLDVL